MCRRSLILTINRIGPDAPESGIRRWSAHLKRIAFEPQHWRASCLVLASDDAQLAGRGERQVHPDLPAGHR